MEALRQSVSAEKGGGERRKSVTHSSSRHRAATRLGGTKRHHRTPDMPGKRVQLDDEIWQALDLLARDQMKTFQELATRRLQTF
jgi:hypothetical protein